MREGPDKNSTLDGGDISTWSTCFARIPIRRKNEILFVRAWFIHKLETNSRLWKSFLRVECMANWFWVCRSSFSILAEAKSQTRWLTLEWYEMCRQYGPITVDGGNKSEGVSTRGNRQLDSALHESLTNSPTMCHYHLRLGSCGGWYVSWKTARKKTLTLYNEP